MNNRQRKDFLIISSVLFAVSSISYFLLTMTSYEQLETIKTLGIAYPFDAIFLSVVVGYIAATVYYLIKLSTVFLEKRRLWFRIVSAVFFPITVCIGLFVSFFTTLPYGIYNIVMIARDSKKDA